MGPHISKVLEFVDQNSETIKAAVNFVINLVNKPAVQPAPMPKSGLNGETVEFWETQRQLAHKQFKMDTVKYFNFAFCGKVNAGKSSLINALRGIRKGEDGWAPTSGFEETSKIKPYRAKPGHADYLVLWDIPGWGTMSVPSATYFMDQKLFAFDFLFILNDGAFGEKDLEIAEVAKKLGVPFAFVRTKCDNNLRSDYVDNGRALTNKIKADFVLEGTTSLYKDYASVVKPPLFFISSPVILNPVNNAMYKLEEDKLIQFVSQKVAERRS